MAKARGRSGKRGGGPPDGTAPASARRHSARGEQPWSATTSRETEIPEVDPHIWSLAVSPDGRRLLTGREGGAAVLADLETGATVRVLAAGDYGVSAVAFLPDGRHALTGGYSNGAFLWDLDSGQRLRRIGPTDANVKSLALFPDGKTVLLGTMFGDLLVCDLATGTEQRRLTGHRYAVGCVELLPGAARAISGGNDHTVRLWDLATGRELCRFDSHQHNVEAVAALPDGRHALSGYYDGTLWLWDLETGAEIRRFQAADGLRSLALLPDGRRAIAGSDTTIQLWDLETGRELRRIEGHAGTVNNIALHPDGRRFVAADRTGAIHIWPIDEIAPDLSLYTTARVALLGDSGVGKTGLGWRIAHGTFREHPSTHGQQFWVVDRLSDTRPDGSRCEIVLWDLAGQPDYRLIHALFLHHVDVGLLLFDPANREKPLSGVEYWIKHLHAATLRQAVIGATRAGDALGTVAPTLLVAARADRGTPTLTDTEIAAFCQRHGIAGYVRTSALDNTGIDELLARIKAAIPWRRLTQTVTTDTFKRIKDLVLRLKEAGGSAAEILLPDDALRAQLQATDPVWQFTDAEMLTAVHHLANHGYVALIQRADGGHAILLAADLLVNLAASVVLEARRHERGLGMVDEARLLAGLYPLPELAGLTVDQQRLLLDEAVRLFLRRNLCFRETVNGATNLVFPSLINEKRPITAAALTDDVTYRVTGEVETVYPALVVQLGYTSLFQRENHWQTRAEYELEPGQLCGFHQTAEGDGEIELVLAYSPTAGEDSHLLFRGVFERFLKRRRVQVRRLPAVICPGCGQAQDRTAVRSTIEANLPHLFCYRCGTKLPTPALTEIGMPPEDKAETVRQATETADRRTDYEVAISWVKSFRRDRGDVTIPSCFISYAWGDPLHERWVEDLADHLQQSEIAVTLDKWHCRPGMDLAQFVQRIDPSDFICAIGTPRYRLKYEDPNQDAVVRAELRVINARHMKRDVLHDTVIPLLRQGTRDGSFPSLLQTSVFVDMRDDRDFLSRLFELVLTIHRIRFDEPMARKYRAQIAGDDRR